MPEVNWLTEFHNALEKQRLEQQAKYEEYLLNMAGGMPLFLEEMKLWENEKLVDYWGDIKHRHPLDSREDKMWDVIRERVKALLMERLNANTTV